MQNLVLKALQDNAERTSTDATGQKWGTVYLDNARFDVRVQVSAHQFAGYLSALEHNGYYKPIDGAFGDVVIGGI